MTETQAPVPSGREVIDRLITPTGEWQLQRRGSHYEIICNGVFLMASYNRASDRALAALALERVRSNPIDSCSKVTDSSDNRVGTDQAAGDRLRVLVGGLGIGFTAQAVLEDRRVSRLEVVEIEPVVVAWHRAYLAALCGRPLDDPRTELAQADLALVPLSARAYDAILLDTDNGPGWLIRDLNARLYTAEAIRRFLDALTPRGVLAYWSAEPAPELAEVLAGRGASVEVIEVEDQIAPGRRGTAWLYLATKGVGGQVSGVGPQTPDP